MCYPPQTFTHFCLHVFSWAATHFFEFTFHLHSLSLCWHRELLKHFLLSLSAFSSSHSCLISVLSLSTTQDSLLLCPPHSLPSSSLYLSNLAPTPLFLVSSFTISTLTLKNCSIPTLSLKNCSLYYPITTVWSSSGLRSLPMLYWT